MSKHDKIAKLKEIIRHLVVQELRKDDIEEVSTTATAGIDGTGTGHYDTPHAFASGSVGHKSPEVGGYKKIKEDIDVGHQDDEPDMLKSTAMEIVEYGKKLYDALDKYDEMEDEVDFPNWWQSKLIVAKDYLQKAYHYLDSEEKKDGVQESINEKTSPNEMYDDMIKTLNTSNQKKALQRLIDEFELGRVYYMFSTNRRGFFQAVLTAEALMKAKNLKEGRYHEWRNDESLTPKQKIGQSVKEIRDSLNELDKRIKMNLKLKTELNVDSRDYWRNTHKALTKISERLVKMANKVGNLK